MDDAVFSRSTPIYRQIVAKFEDDIYSGRLPEGARIAPTLELAREFGVGRNAVQQALVILAERGLVERHAKRGTFVRGQCASRTLGVLFGRNIVAEQYSQFLRLVYGEIVRQATVAGWRTELYFPVTGESYSRYISQIERDITNGDLSAVMNFDDSDLMSECLRSAGCVAIDYKMGVVEGNPHDPAFYQGLDYLLDRGFRDIAVIQSDLVEERGLKELLKKHGGGGEAIFFKGREISEAGGMEVGERIFSDSSRFDAVLVLNDTLCRGVLFHMMSLGIRIPEDVAVMAMTNKGHVVLSPVPLTRLEWDPAGIAESNLKRLFARISGIPVDERVPVLELIVGKSCGEDGKF